MEHHPWKKKNSHRSHRWGIFFFIAKPWNNFPEVVSRIKNHDTWLQPMNIMDISIPWIFIICIHLFHEYSSYSFPIIMEHHLHFQSSYSCSMGCSFPWDMLRSHYRIWWTSHGNHGDPRFHDPSQAEGLCGAKAHQVEKPTVDESWGRWHAWFIFMMKLLELIWIK